MTPMQYAAWLESRLKTEVQAAVDQSAVMETKRMRDQIPSSRRLTRRAFRHRVRHRSKHSEIRIGLKFSRRYPIRGTDTQRLMVRLWKQNKHHFRPTLDSILNKRIRSI